MPFIDRAHIAVLSAFATIVLASPANAEGSSFDTRSPLDPIVTGVAWSGAAVLVIERKLRDPDPSCELVTCGRRDTDGARPFNATWDRISYATVGVGIVGALGPSLGRWMRGDEGRGGVGDSAVVHAEALGLTMLLTETAKTTFPRYRPFLAFDPADSDHVRTTADVQASFWSGHTALAFSSAAVGSVDAFRSPGPLGPWVPALGLHALALSTGLFRVLAGMHHISDVAVGAAVGSAVGLAVSAVHSQPSGATSSQRSALSVGAQGPMLVIGGMW